MTLGVAVKFIRGLAVGLEYFSASAYNYFTVVLALGIVRISVFAVPMHSEETED